GLELETGERVPSWEHTALTHDLALPAQGRGKVGEGREVSAGPDRAKGRDGRRDVEAEEIDEPLQHGLAHGRVASGEGRETGHEDGAAFVPAEVRADAASVE